jgi:hypothetical protein
VRSAQDGRARRRGCRGTHHHPHRIVNLVLLISLAM